MKRLFVATLIVFAGSFVLTHAFAASENQKSTVDLTARTAAARRKARAKTPKPDLKFLESPNTIKTRLKKYEGLEKALTQITKPGRKEVSEWTEKQRARTAVRIIGDRVELAEDVQKQFLLELAFIRKLAIEDGAKKTTAAIEALVLDKNLRYEGIIVTLKDNKRIASQQEREAKRKAAKKKAADSSTGSAR